MKKQKKENRGRPKGSFTIKILPDGTTKKISIFEYKDMLKKNKKPKSNLELFEEKIIKFIKKSKHKEMVLKDGYALIKIY